MRIGRTMRGASSERVPSRSGRSSRLLHLWRKSGVREHDRPASRPRRDSVWPKLHGVTSYALDEAARSYRRGAALQLECELVHESPDLRTAGGRPFPGPQSKTAVRWSTGQPRGFNPSAVLPLSRSVRACIRRFPGRWRRSEERRNGRVRRAMNRDGRKPCPSAAS